MNRFPWLGWLRSAGVAATVTLLGFFACATAYAAVFPNLYEVTVKPNASAPEGVRTAAARLAMHGLLERVTGQRAAAADPALAELIDNADSYVRSYATLEGDRIRVGFIADKVDQALMSRGWPVWGEERPLTIVWIAVSSPNGERSLVSSDGSGPERSVEMQATIAKVRADVRTVAKERGLPIVLPLLDLEDLGKVAFVDVWGGFDERIERASERYGADAVLVGRIRQTAQGDHVQWTLLRGNERRVTTSDSVAEGLQWLADRYAEEYSVVGGVRTVRMLIRGVQTLDDYGRVMRYLNHLSALTRVGVDRLADGQLALRVASHADRPVLAKTISLSHIVEPVKTAGLNGGRSGTSGSGTAALGPLILQVVVAD